jgi:photosystem II stability/assembly factor-like uncharacterized protein/tetratricopeptide (TPR) repeat protein
MRPFLPALAVTAALSTPLCAANPCHFDDAPLRAVQFVDANEGWAVGDEGVIWHTIDGGKNWERQPSGVRASLRSVQFLTPFIGWVAGRQELPYGGGSLGVLLVTRDGGCTWQPVSLNTLPGLNCVRFFDDKFGIAAGDGSEQFPTGVFTTGDGGRTWKPLPGPRCPSWLAADFRQDGQVGALAGGWSRLASLQKGSLTAADVDTLGGRTLHGVQLVGEQAVAVGEGGLVLVSTKTAGVRWGFADLKLPADALACLDFYAVHSRGEHVWVAGRPGSIVLHSRDRGRTWDVRHTGQSLALHGIFFLTEQRGWAVGELGTVLGTDDGGKSWTVQRKGGNRAALLCIHARRAGIPLETMALVGGDEGYLVTALQVTAPDPASALPARAADGWRCNQAVRMAGGAAGEMLWQFPLPEYFNRSGKVDLVRSWDRLHGDHAAEQLLRQIVLALRTWQPDVVVADGSDGAPLEALVAEAVQQAFERAADSKAFPEHIDKLGLQPWKATKLYCRSNQGADASVVLHLRTAKPSLRSSAVDFVAPASVVLADEPTVSPSQSAYRLVASRNEGGAKHKGLLDGSSLTYGGAARRAQQPPAALDANDEAAQKTRRQLQALLEAPDAGPADPNRLLVQIGPLLKALPDDEGAPAVFGVAHHFVRKGQWLLAREAFLLMADRYPAHPLSAQAYRWLIRQNASSEARRRHELGQFLLPPAPEVRQAAASEINRNGAEARPLRLLGDLAEARRWNEGALATEPRLAGFGPLFANDPAAQFCLQAARRNLKQTDEAKQWYTRFLEKHPEGPWHDAAAAELWLANRSGPAPKPVAWCRQTTKRPHLDGAFDDACWQGVEPLQFRNVSGDTSKDYPTEARLAYDKEFLYLALRCEHPADRHVAPVKVRQRDADLRDFDRVSLLIDLDRDYSTYFHFQVDQRGCLSDDCWGDKSWNPRWFVAVRSDATSWQIEAAIPLKELTGDPLPAGRAWACNLVRILPGRGVQAWSAPADVEPRPEGMGLLIFTEGSKIDERR